jgi:hypothetical protein
MSIRLKQSLNFRPIAILVLVLLTASSIALVARPASATDYVQRFFPGSTLYPGESLWSPSRLYRLTQQTDGNLVLYSMPGNKPFWASGTFNHPNSVTQMQSDGNLVVYAPGHVAIWASGTAGHPNSVLFMQDDANVVIYAPGNVAIWATNAQNVVGCTDGSRTQAAQYAASGQYYVPVPRVGYEDQVGTTNNSAGWVELRYYPATRCAWALAFGGAIANVYIDRSRDGGRTWVGPLGSRSLGWAGNTYTGVYNDSYPYVVRACVVAIYYHCTSWF